VSMLDRMRGGTVARHYQLDTERFRGLVAAAEPLPAAGEFATRAMQRRPQWQTEAWAYLDTLGEAAYGANFVGDALARLRLYIADADDPDHEPIPEEADREAYEALAALGATGPILHDLGVNTTVVGECILLGVPAEDAGPDEWSIVSTDAFRVKGRRFELIEDTGVKGTPLPDETYAARIWQAHPRRRLVADAPFRPVLSSCEELLMLEAADRAALRTRLVAPLLAIPEGASIVSPDPTVTSQGPSRFASDLQKAMIEPVSDESHPSRLSPIVIEAKGEFLEQVRTISLQSSLDATIGERYERNVKRLSLGLWVPPEVLTGVADVNNWNAWYVERSTWKAHLQPRAVFAVGALTKVFLHQALGRTDRVIWFDPADIVNPTPTADDAHKALQAGAISVGAYRDRLGFSDADAPTGDPVTQIVVRMVSAAPSLAIEPGVDVLYDRLAGLPGIRESDADTAPSDDAGDGGEGAGGEPAPGPPTTGPTVATVAAASVDPLDRLAAGLAEADAVAFDRLTEAAEATLESAVRRVGAKVRSKVRGDSQLAAAIDRVDNSMVARTLGREIVATFGLDDVEAVEDTIGRLRPRFERIVADAHDRAAQLVEEHVGPDAATEFRGEAGDDTGPAWTWLAAALSAGALSVLFDPAPVAEGEFDHDARVAPATVREALARAGGADRVRAVAGRIRDVEVALRARGVATSVRLINLLSRFGVQERALQWDYRPAISRASFPAHLALHGTQAETEDGFGGCPWGRCAPSDHRGCRCAYSTVLAADAQDAA